jgi:hypothetical protein
MLSELGQIQDLQEAGTQVIDEFAWLPVRGEQREQQMVPSH